MNTDPRITELRTLAESEGLTLPYSPELIIAMEDAGHVINLVTGDIVLGEADRPYEWQWTEAGQALAKELRYGL
jgi:hypothetical protein